MNRINPYEMLLGEFREFANMVCGPRRITMWSYPKEKLATSWRLDDLAERVAAAAQLGFEVHLESFEGALVVKYVTKRPDRPWRV